MEESDLLGGQRLVALGTREMIKFWNENYGENVSSGSYDDVRRRDLVYLVECGLVQKMPATRMRARTTLRAIRREPGYD